MTATTTTTTTAPLTATPSLPPTMFQFLSWVAANRQAPMKINPQHECYKAPDPEAGFCEASTFVLSDESWSVAWQTANPAAFEFESSTFHTGRDVSCADFSAKQVRRWRWRDPAGAGANLSHCILGADRDPRLAGLHLWIKNAESDTYLRVFSDEYLKVAPYDFANLIMTEGETL